MADVFTDDGGSNTSPYETWAKAATTHLVAVDFASAGDRLIVGHDHSEALGGNTTYTYPGTAGAPNLVISATSTAGGSVVTYNKADNVQIDSSGGVRDITINGNVHFYGVSIKCGDDLILGLNPHRIFFDDSVCELSSVGAFFRSGSNNGQNHIILKNTDVNFSGGGIGAGFSQTDGGLFEWIGGTLSWTGTQPQFLFECTDENGYLYVSGVDLTAVTTILCDVSDNSQFIVSFHHCLLVSGVALTGGTISDTATQILMSGCDDTTGNNLYRLDYVDFWGSTVHDDAIFRTSGAKDPDGNNISWKMVSTANAAEFSEPTKSPPIPKWIKTTGSKTFTIHIVLDSATDLDDDEVWAEVEFLEASADTDSAFSDDRMADITATPAAQATSTEGWTGTGGFSNENKQQLDVTVTVNRVGPVIVRVYLAKPSTTIYIDPKIEVA